MESDIVGVDISAIDPSILNSSIYIKRGGKMLLYRDQKHPLTENDLERLKEKGCKKLYISSKAAKALRKQAALESAPSLSKDAVSEILRLRSSVSEEAFNQAFQGSAAETVSFCEDMSRSITKTLVKEEVVASELFELLRHDTTTYTHSMNVGIYCGLLARELGIKQKDELSEIVIGGLLHDLGKREIQLRVLNKPGKLNDGERKHIENHPSIGFQILRKLNQEGHDSNEEHPRSSWKRLMMVYQHHEHPDGSGYPVGISGDEIHMCARICAVADVFHALTSERPYRTPMAMAEACEYLLNEVKVKQTFDKEIVECWTTYCTTVKKLPIPHWKLPS